MPVKGDGQYVKTDVFFVLFFFCGIIPAWWEMETNIHEISEKTTRMAYYEVPSRVM